MTFHFEEVVTENLETLLFYTEKLLAVEKKQPQKLAKKQLPAREGDTRGTRPLRLEAVDETSSNHFTNFER